jgi:hypothetical protein
MAKKTILILTIFVFLFIFANSGKCVRPFEVTYPRIAGEELTVSEGLPGYVKYIFHLAVGIIGFVIFGVLIYNGIRYLVSAGNPQQMADARTGILYAFLGGILLFCSFLIFETINPQLKILKLPPIRPVEQVVIPGVYICTYQIEEKTIGDALEKYIKESGKEQIEAAKKLREIISWDSKTKQGCQRINASDNLRNFKGGVTENNTIFFVPSISIDPNTKERTPKYEYGIILHEKENFGGRCFIPKSTSTVPSAITPLIYDQIEHYSPKKDINDKEMKDLKFKARSVTLFQKPSEEPAGDGVTLYSCLNYNRDVDETGQCDGIVAIEKSFQPGPNDIIKISEAELGISSANTLKDNTRSISFSPKGSYLALLYKSGNFDGRCKLLDKNHPNLYDVLPKTGDCATGFFAFWNVFTIGKCRTLLGSMIVIEGSRL